MREVAAPATQGRGDTLDHARPVARASLAKEPRGWIPWTVVAIERPAPAAVEARQYAHRLSHAAYEMKHRGVH